MEENSKSLVKKLIEITSENELGFKKLFLSIVSKNIDGFFIRDKNKETYNDLLYYFTGNEGKLDLNKGIYLYGNYGSGKTTCMRAFSIFLANSFPFSQNGFGNTSIEKMASEYKSSNDLSKYGRSYEKNEVSTKGNKFINTEMKAFRFCFNELGKPINEKFYGTDIQQVINSIMMIRYELFQENKIASHATSNYHPGKLDCFDEPLLDRFSEMFNFIEFKGDSLR